jgi:hypothetical protein
MLEMTYAGNVRNGPSAVGDITEYTFLPPANSSFDTQLSGIFVQTLDAVNAQSWEVEIVTNYVSLPFEAASDFLPVTKYAVDLDELDAVTTHAYNRDPLFTVERTAVKDDGAIAAVVDDIRLIWNGAKAVYDAGVKVANWVGESLSDLFSTKKHLAYQILLQQLPPEFYNDFSDFLARSSSHSVALATLRDAQRQDADEKEYSHFKNLLKRLHLNDDDLLSDICSVPSNTPSQPSYRAPPVLRRS